MFGYVGGYTLEQKVASLPFTLQLIDKQQNPWTFVRGIRQVRKAVESGGFDIVHAHLTYDHWLAVFAARNVNVKVIRTFHAIRPLKDPLATPYLLRSTDGVASVNERFAAQPYLRRHRTEFTPPPVDHRQFSPKGGDVRARYGLSGETAVLGVIGKVSPGRGFEQAFQVFAHVKQQVRTAKMLVIGRGPHRPFLESLTRELGVANDVVWAGYHEAELAEHYRSMDLMLFTATGSDEGHRAVSEAMACGTPAICYPVPGVEYVVGDLASQLVVAEPRSELLGNLAITLLPDKAAGLRPLCAVQTSRFAFGPTSDRLKSLYNRVLSI